MTTADLYLEKFMENIPFEIDIFTKTQKIETVSFRALFTKILLDKAKYTPPMVKEYFKSKGLVRNHATLINAINQIDTYYENFYNFQEDYNLFFDDKKIYSNPIKLNVVKKYRDRLDELIDNVPDDKRDEIYEQVNLRIKSWSWKNRDYCEVIECYNSLIN